MPDFKALTEFAAKFGFAAVVAGALLWFVLGATSTRMEAFETALRGHDKNTWRLLRVLQKVCVSTAISARQDPGTCIQETP